MKRINNLYDKICSMDNLMLADAIAQDGKGKQYGVIRHNLRREANIAALRDALTARQYKTSAYTIFKVYEPKEREVYRLPYYPDRIVHHAIMNLMEPIFVSGFTADTYSCIKKRGVHKAVKKLKAVLKNVENTRYCLKIDVRKFYPSVSHDILKSLLRRKIKDTALLELLDEIIDSAPGLPIGNYLSQYFANYYLSGFDHWIKEEKRRRDYLRYLDDMVFFASNKKELHALLADIRHYLKSKLGLDIKSNYQIFPVEKRGVDILGYVFFHTHVILRPSIKKRFARAIARGANIQTINSYRGWAKHCNARHLIKKLLPDEQF